MNESDKTNELDNFGVWVKKPPRTVSSEDSSENEGADAGDKGMEDIDINAFMDGADFSDGSQDKKEEPAQAESSPSNETEEVSLDEFLDGGVFEGDDGGSAASEKSEQKSKAAFEANPEPVPVEDFSSSSDITVSDSEPAAASDDSPLDIDLSFDDEPAASDSSSSSEPQFETIDSFDSPASQSSGLTSSSPSSSSASSDGTESVDLSEFGFDIDAPESTGEEKTEEKPQETQSSSSGETEDVDLSEFGFDIDAPENPAEEKAPEQAPAQAETKAEEPSSQETAPAPAETHNIDENGMEEVSLDDFGFDINAEEGASESKSEPEEKEETKTEPQIETQTSSSNDASQTEDISLDTSTTSPIEDADLDSLSLDTSSSENPSLDLPDTGDIEMNVKADDDMEITPQNESADDKTIAGPEQKSENIDDLNLNSELEEIPDSFDEETASLFAEEPSENNEKQDSKDDSKETAQDTDDEKTLAENVISEDEPVFEENSVELSEIPDIPEEAPKAEENQKTEETSSAAESNPFTLPPDDAFVPDAHPEAEKETAAAGNPSESEKQQESDISSAPAEKDPEIAASTNAILNQIVSELASLKSEISGLKNEFEEIKSKESDSNETPAASEQKPEEEQKEPESKPQEESTGFFSENGEDDTIALSVDELDNILNNAEMVDETPSENSTEEPKNEELEQNSLEETISDAVEPEDLPDYTDDDDSGNQNDIFVPKPEEISEAQSQIDFGNGISDENGFIEQKDDSTLADSLDSNEENKDEDFSLDDFSFDDDTAPKAENPEPATTLNENQQDEIQPEEILSDEMIDSINSSDSISSNSSDEEKPAEDSNEGNETVDEPFDFGSDSSDSSASNEEEKTEEIPAVEEPKEQPEESSVAISNEELDNLLAPDPSISESLTDENLNYLASDKALENNTADDEEENETSSIPGNLKKEIKSVLSYMDQLLENLPEDKIAEFAQSEQFETYKKLFKELGLDKQ